MAYVARAFALSDGSRLKMVVGATGVTSASCLATLRDHASAPQGATALFYADENREMIIPAELAFSATSDLTEVFVTLKAPAQVQG